MTTNLNSKNIREFTPADTIYIRDKDAFNREIFLCQFSSFNEKTGAVTGIVLDDKERKIGGIRVNVGKVLTANVKSCALYGVSNGVLGNAHCHWFNHLGFALMPVDEEKQNENDVHVPEHETYGVIRGSRRTTKGTPLFGTSVSHNQTISITLLTATHKRDLANDFISGKREIIEVELSENQFAQFITSMNQHSGTPCTIRHINGKRTGPTPFISKQEVFQQEFEKKMSNLAVDIKKTIQTSTDILTNKATLNKDDRKMLLQNIKTLTDEVANNIPFVREQFREQLDNMITEAKVELEAFAENLIRTKGLEALGASNEDFRNILQTAKQNNDDAAK